MAKEDVDFNTDYELPKSKGRLRTADDGTGGFWQLPLAMLTGGLASAPLVKQNMARQRKAYADKVGIDTEAFGDQAGISTREGAVRGRNVTDEAMRMNQMKNAQMAADIRERAMTMGYSPEDATRLAAESMQRQAMQDLQLSRRAKGGSIDAERTGRMSEAATQTNLDANMVADELQKEYMKGATIGAGDAGQGKTALEIAKARADRQAAINAGTRAEGEATILPQVVEKTNALTLSGLDQKKYESDLAAANQKNLAMQQQISAIEQELEMSRANEARVTEPLARQGRVYDANLAVSPYVQENKRLKAMRGDPTMVQAGTSAVYNAGGPNERIFQGQSTDRAIKGLGGEVETIKSTPGGWLDSTPAAPAPAPAPAPAFGAPPAAGGGFDAVAFEKALADAKARIDASKR